MIFSIALDALLLVIIIAVVPVGMYRGGLREVCTSAGLLLGTLVAREWSTRWGEWLSDMTGIDLGVSRFLVAVGTMIIVTATVGYGSASSFEHRPGPGGRMFGGLLALANALIFLGALIQFVSEYLYGGVYPDIIRSGFVSRALSVGFDWVLLVVTCGAIIGILFGMVVRERHVEESSVSANLNPDTAVRRAAQATTPSAKPIITDPDVVQTEVTPEPASTVKVREVRHWEEAVPTTMDDLQSGWSRTWPTTVTSTPTTTPRRSGRGRQPQSKPASPRADEDLLRDWIADGDGSPTRGNTSDE